MPGPTRSGADFRFGPFELNQRTGELRKHDTRIRLREQSCQVLLMLLEKPGEVVTRSTIRNRLWPQDTLVEFDQSINTAVRALRTALNDSAETPVYIETLVKRGYRFLGEVQRIGEPQPQRVAGRSRYRMMEKLGEGGMGAVYRAEDLTLGRTVALKFLPRADGEPSDAARRRFAQEARAASALNHPHICTIHGFEEVDGRQAIVMELLEGETLEARLLRGRLPFSEALRVATQLAGAMAEAHSQGVLHRDLKPANIMLTGNGAKILDFGLARMEETGPDGADSQDIPQPGTLPYIAPELLQGKAADARSDVFSLGCILYELVSGERAFGRSGAPAMVEAILHQEPLPLPAALALEGFARLVGKCLAKAPDNRWQTARDLCNALTLVNSQPASVRSAALAQAGEESQPSGPKRAEELPAPKPRRTGLWVSVVAGAVLANAGLWYMKLHAPPPLPQKLVAVTTYPGMEEYPSFSPDGKQIAFYWDGEKGVNPGIYVKLVGETNALRLTSGQDAYPAWSPDGKRIAFVRGVEPGVFKTGHAIYTVSALGGGERKISDMEVSRQISWSPDGKWLAMASGNLYGSAIFVLPLLGGEPRRISDPKSPAFDTAPAFSPDGHRLAYVGCSFRYSCDVYVLELGNHGAPGGHPRQVTRQGMEMYGLTWSRDGRSLVYSAAHTLMTPYLWRTGSDGRGTPQRVEIAGPMAFAPSASPTAERLLYEKSLLDADIWRYRAGCGLDPILMSSLSDFAPQYSPDGTSIVFCSNRSGERMEIWVAQADGSRPVQLTNGPGRNQGTPRWSPDGRWIAFDSEGEDGHFAIYVMDASGSSPRKVTSESMNTHMPFWAPGGEWIYFTANSQIWRVPFAGGRAETVTTQGASMGYFSADGTALFYTKENAGPVFAKSLAGGEEHQVLPYVNYKAFFPTADGIYYIGRREGDGYFPLEFYQFSSKTSRVLEKIGGQIYQGLTVSPGGKSILFSRSPSGSDLMMIENF